MKKAIYFIFSAFLVANVLAACGKGKETDNGGQHTLDFDSIVIDTMAHLTNSKTSPIVEIHLNIKYAKGKNADIINDSLLRSGILSPDYISLMPSKLSVANALDSFATKFVQDYKRDFGILYAQDTEHATAYRVQYSNNTFLTQGKNGILNYFSHSYSYSGGAYGMDVLLVKNIDGKTGRILKPTDVFVPGFEQPLADMIVEKLCDLYQVKNLKGLQEKGIFQNMEPYATDNFVLGRDGVDFIYCDSEIAPHAVGQIKISFSYDYVEKVLKK